MPKKNRLTPHEQFGNEVRALLNRYVEESDLEECTLAEIMHHILSQWLDEDVLDFSSDIDLEDDD
ncbi:MAG: hypothetical protein CMI15_16265 [Opitutaceae bacterium]|nr:hypothetical protein [Opitutaceae bacterium]|tara:strand:- start:1260 stop:1454 length:195 start_codon:yes stop_codon:yes gene_type:complete